MFVCLTGHLGEVYHAEERGRRKYKNLAGSKTLKKKSRARPVSEGEGWGRWRQGRAGRDSYEARRAGDCGEARPRGASRQRCLRFPSLWAKSRKAVLGGGSLNGVLTEPPCGLPYFSLTTL